MTMQPMRSEDPWKRLRELQDKVDRYIAENRSSMRALGATTFTGDLTVAEGGNVRAEGGQLLAIDPDTGSAAVMLNGRLRLYPTLEDAERYGYISVPLGEDTPNQMWISPPRQDRTRPDDTRLILRGSSDGITGYAWLYSGGGISLNAAETLFLTAADISLNPTGSLFSSPGGGVNLTPSQNFSAIAGGSANLSAADDVTVNAGDLASIFGDRIEIVGGARGTGVFGTPTTSTPANVVLATVEGQWQLARSTSSRRYKQDIETATVDTAEVLTLVGRTWRDKNEVDAPGGTDRRFVGLIAEELHTRPSLRQFVDYDDQDRPDAIQYDRFSSVALLEVVKAQQAQITALTKRLDALEA